MGVFCGKCKLPLDDLPDLAPHKHAPCPVCKSTSRIFDEHIIENALTFRSHLSAVQKRENKTIGFSESERQGRAAAATLQEDGSLSFSLTGSSPQGEEDTLAACRTLVNKLNAAGGNWSQPTVDDAWDDGKALDGDDPKKILRIQVVRVIVDQDLWKKLSKTGKIEEVSSKDELAEGMKAAIEVKADPRKIPKRNRRGLVLVLDATRLPAHGFDAVVEAFRSRWGAWTKGSGFDEVWVVGPSESLTWRLDVVS